MIAMVTDTQLLLDEIRYALCRPQLSPIAVGHCPLRQQPHKPNSLRRSQSRRPTGRRLRFKTLGALRSPRHAPSQHTAGVTPDPTRNLVQRKVTPKKVDDATPPLLKNLRRTMRSHEAILHSDDPRLLHYLCGCQ